MLCPSCGNYNSDNSGQCSNCGYKFHFGQSYNDPKKIKFVKWSSKISKLKIARYLFVSIFLIIFVLIILSWFEAM